jgi:hypothetical protein
MHALKQLGGYKFQYRGQVPLKVTLVVDAKVNVRFESHILHQQAHIYKLSVDARSQLRHCSTRQQTHIKEYRIRARRRFPATASRDVWDAVFFDVAFMTCGALSQL